MFQFEIENKEYLTEVKEKKNNSFCLEFTLEKGFILKIPYENKELAKKAGFKFSPQLKFWTTWHYDKAYSIFINEKNINISKQLRNFFNFWEESIWKKIKIIRQSIFILKKDVILLR